MRRLIPVVTVVLLIAGCTMQPDPPGTAIQPVSPSADAFVMSDGMRLSYRAWLPDREPNVVALALHGMNDSRDAWEIPGPDFAHGGIAVFAPDQRGFGASATRSYWPGAEELVADARVMATLLRQRFPRAQQILIGESMGAAVLMVLATQPDAPVDARYVMIAPAVWARAEMNALIRTTLWLAINTMPGAHLDGRGIVSTTASDNIEVLRRLWANPLTIKSTRFDAVGGLVNLMDAALASAPAFRAPSLFLYGGRDELIPNNATAATWRALPAEPVRAYYPNSYHLALRDLSRAIPIDDIISWIHNPAAPLPSGADRAADAWLAHHEWRQP